MRGAYDSARKPKPRADGAVQISDGGRNAFEGEIDPLALVKSHGTTLAPCG
jgi:hypothetical protein